MKTFTVHRPAILLAACYLVGLAAIVWLPSSAAAAGPWYVAPGGSDASDCLSPGTACATINGAIGKAAAGDTILVAIGTYTGAGSEAVLINKSVTISGGWDAATFSVQAGGSVIDAPEAQAGFRVNVSASTVLQRFTIRNSGYGIANSGTLAAYAVTVYGSYWRGIYNQSGASAQINNSTISGNGSLVYAGGGISNEGTLSLRSSTVTGNRASSGGGIINWMGGTVTLENAILSGNSAASGPDCLYTIGSAGYNLIGSTAGCTFTPTTGDVIGADASLGSLIGTASGLWYHPLLGGSAAIDAGNPGGCTDHLGTELTMDQRGAGRVGTCDIGAYEYMTPGSAASVEPVSGSSQRAGPGLTFAKALGAAVLDAQGSPAEGVTVTFTAPASGPSGTFADSGTRITTAGTNASGVATSSLFTANTEMGVYAVGAAAEGVGPETGFDLSNVAWYVALAGNDGNDCLSPATACAGINGALAKPGFVLGDAVLVQAGTFIGSGSQVALLNKNVILSGGWDGGFTTQAGTSTLDGQGARTGVTVPSGVVATISLFTIRKGYGSGISIQGTLTLNDSDVVENNTGIYNDSSGTVIINRSSVRQNTTQNTSASGAGILNYGTAVVNDSSISGNTAGTSSGYGGGIRSSGTLYLNNSTVSGNAAAYGGGIYIWSGDAQLNSSTVTGNTATRTDWVYGPGGGIARGGGTLVLRNTIVAGNNNGASPDCWGSVTSAGYNLIGDTTGCNFTPAAGERLDVEVSLGPLQDNGGPTPTHALQRQCPSPAINAGNPAGCTDHLGDGLLTDQRGMPRVKACDIGAYEFQEESACVFLPCVLRSYCAPLYHDEFSDPGSGWPVADTGDVTYEYLAGEYRILVKSNDWWAGATPGFAATDYVVELDVRSATTSDGSYGLLFGLSNDWEEFYEFDINQGGYFGVYKYDSGAWTELASGSSAAIHTGTATNRLKILREGTTIQAYANGTLLATVADGFFTGMRRLGVIAFSYQDPNVDARFENFTVYPVTCISSEGLAQDVLLPTQGTVGDGRLKAWAGGPDSGR